MTGQHGSFLGRGEQPLEHADMLELEDFALGQFRVANVLLYNKHFLGGKGNVSLSYAAAVSGCLAVLPCSA